MWQGEEWCAMWQGEEGVRYLAIDFGNTNCKHIPNNRCQLDIILPHNRFKFLGKPLQEHKIDRLIDWMFNGTPMQNFSGQNSDIKEENTNLYIS